MKRVLASLVLILGVASGAFAQTVANDLAGLGMPAEQADYLASIIPAGAALDNNVYLKANNQAGNADVNLIKLDTSDNTVINSSASDDLILQLEDDANRLISFDAASDTALAMSFGDGGTTAGQGLLIAASTADGDDDYTLSLAAGGAGSESRGGYVLLRGNEHASAGDVVIASGNSTGSNVLSYIAGTLETSLGASGLAFQGAGDSIQHPAYSVMTPSTNSTPVAGGSITGIMSAVATAMPTANSFVSLPAATPHVGKNFVVYNQSAHPLKLVPATGDSILPAAAITPFTCATGLRCDCLVMDGTSWVCE